MTASQRPMPCWVELPRAEDARGTLTSIESGVDIPFETKRVFFITDASGDRGNHAHRYTSQLIVAVAGTFSVDVSTGGDWATYEMIDPRRALYLPPMTWVRLYAFSPDAICLALADTRYAESVYVRDWNEFVSEATSKSS